jgi:hypothetical protein
MIKTILLASLIVIAIVSIQQQQVKASDEIMTSFRNDVNAFKKTVDSTKFVAGNGVVKGLTEKLLQLGGGAYQIGGAAIPLLYSTEDYFINKVKQAGPQAFNQSEQDEIKSWINYAMEKRKEHPDSSSSILGSNFSASK